MTRHELATAYPGAAGLCWWFEEDMEETWEFARTVGSPAAVVATFKRLAAETLKVESRGQLVHVVHEMDHPDFLRYVAGKLGAV